MAGTGLYGFIPAITDDRSSWVVVYRERRWDERMEHSEDPRAVGNRFNLTNGRRPPQE
jgi:hypothetical protein